MTAYRIALGFHSYWRWLVLLLALTALFRALRSWVLGRPWSDGDGRLSKWFVGAVDVQLLVGALMYCAWSPFSQAVFHAFSASMKDPVTRFFGLEHAVTMLRTAGPGFA
jgi:hypothetical protein